MPAAATDCLHIGASPGWPVARVSALLIGLAGVGGCTNWALLDPHGPVGQAERTILIDSLAIMLAIVVPTIFATLAFAFWFRSSNIKARYLPDWEFSGRIELVVWAIPTLTVILLGGVTWIGSHQLDPARPLPAAERTLDVQVIALDWKWLFIYPREQVATVNELVVPAGVPIRFTITSASVWNAFFVPRLGSMIYAMNGMRTTLYLQADSPGEWFGLSAHFSGDGFSDMHFPVRSVPSAHFDDWIAQMRTGNGRLDAERYLALTRPNSPTPLVKFAAVEHGLFDRVVARHLEPAPGPMLERGGAVEISPSAKRLRAEPPAKHH